VRRPTHPSPPFPTHESVGRRYFSLPDHSCDRHVPGHICEFDVDQLKNVQGAMVVPARGDRRGDHDSCSIDALEDALEVTLPGDLFDKYWRETFGA
jgi:hypothetical protein